MVSVLIWRKTVLTAVLLLLVGALLIQGATVFEGSATRDVTIATYYVGAVITFAIALIPWSKE